jgi:hypothetical protein
MITFLYLFYNNHRILSKHIEEWNQYPHEVKSQVKFILIDDGSAIPLVIPSCDINLEVFRIEKDIPWNVTGARNLGFCMASTEYVFTSDMDALFPRDSAKKLIDALPRVNTRTLYWFPRKDMKGNHEKDRHLLTIMLSKRLYWEVGGMDEDFAGKWGYEDLDFIRRIPPEETSLIRASVINYKDFDDASTTTISREITNESLGRDKKYGVVPTSRQYLRFPWRKVHEQYYSRDPVLQS